MKITIKIENPLQDMITADLLTTRNNILTLNSLKIENLQLINKALNSENGVRTITFTYVQNEN